MESKKVAIIDIDECIYRFIDDRFYYLDIPRKHAGGGLEYTCTCDYDHDENSDH